MYKHKCSVFEVEAIKLVAYANARPILPYDLNLTKSKVLNSNVNLVTSMSKIKYKALHRNPATLPNISAYASRDSQWR